MKRARLVTLAISLIAGGLAAHFASSGDGKETVTVVQQLPTTDVLVARRDIQVGHRIAADDLQWQAWAESAGSVSFIRRNEKPNAIAQFVGSMARSPLMEGEPVREQKLVRADGSGFLAAVLPSGMRAVSTEIKPETGAGGFILPNDRVDVVLTRHEKAGSGEKSQEDAITSEIVLTNVRVLAIDQTPNGRDDKATVLGKTATLALKPDEVKRLEKARMSGALSLALRSIADFDKHDVSEGGSNLITIHRGPSAAEETLICEPSCQKL
jgi:pilus assembly protein CpaB